MATQWDYLHLRSLRDSLHRALDQVPVNGHGPALDLYCGTKPYSSLSPVQPVFGYDVDDHFGSADVTGGIPLPFRSRSFSLVLCTQALHLVDEPAVVVSETERVLVTGGWAVVTVPHIFRRELPYERKMSAGDLRELFRGWRDVRVEAVRGPGTGAALVAGKVAAGAARRWHPLRPVLPAMALAFNSAGTVADVLARPLWDHYPASLLLVARTR